MTTDDYGSILDELVAQIDACKKLMLQAALLLGNTHPEAGRMTFPPDWKTFPEFWNLAWCKLLSCGGPAA
eukprot:8429722-Alexandrium_andersonii.AAC.1